MAGNDLNQTPLAVPGGEKPPQWKGRAISWSMARYMMREVLFTFVGGTSIFLLIMLMFQAIRLSEFIIFHQVSLYDVGRLSAYLMLSFLPIAVPVAFLFSIMMGVSRANSEAEILAFQVNGISLKQLYAPLGVLGGLVMLGCLYTSLYTVPKGNRGFELLITRLGSERVISQLKSGVFLDGFFGLTLLSEKVIPGRNELKNVFIYDRRDEEHPLVITSKAGILRVGQENPGMVTLRLTDGSIYVEKGQADGVQQKINFELYDINLDADRGGNAWRDYSPPSLNYEQLKERIVATEHDPPTHRKLEVELHRRFSLSVACIVFSLLGFAIGVRSKRGLRSSAIVLCLLIGVIYWLTYVVANALAIGGSVPPWLGVWAPNVLFGVLPFFLMRRYRWA